MSFDAPITCVCTKNEIPPLVATRKLFCASTPAGAPQPPPRRNEEAQRGRTSERADGRHGTEQRNTKGAKIEAAARAAALSSYFIDFVSRPPANVLWRGDCVAVEQINAAGDESAKMHTRLA